MRENTRTSGSSEPKQFPKKPCEAQALSAALRVGERGRGAADLSSLSRLASADQRVDEARQARISKLLKGKEDKEPSQPSSTFRTHAR